MDGYVTEKQRNIKMLTIKTNFKNSPACAFNRNRIAAMFEPTQTIGEAASALKNAGLDVVMIIDSDREMVWVIGGRPPQREDGTWQEWYIMVTPQDPNDTRCVAQTYQDNSARIFPEIKEACDHVLSRF